ncbi:MAG: hypothetical protein H6505_03770 [Calditrichaeota bacterium]|nr:hypothetical protein [Calditrichota bacterium]
MLIALIALVSACSNSKKTEPKSDAFEELEFTVDSTKLGDSLSIGGVKLRAPAEWAPLDSETFETLTNVAARDTSKLGLTPVMAYRKPGGGPLLLVSTFAQPVDLGVSFIPWAGQVADVYRKQRPDAQFSEAWLSLGGVEALQIMGIGEKLVHLKLILHGDQPVSLDYTVPRTTWKDDVEYVESSLGSIRKIYPS